MLVSAQRQGRINFYLPSFGEEGAVVGSASAWNATDDIFAAVREVGVLLHRNYPLPLLMGQVFASTSDSGTKGRQMACHYGATEERFHTLSSPIGTQIPQAAGAAYALKLDQQRKRTDSCVVCYLGDGAASQGDFHAGVNMASVLGGPIIFFVRNNGFAISTPVEEQYKSDGIASRGPGYGIPTVRVDGNDPLAVYLVCVEARRIAVENQRPVMVEAMTYRIGHHSTSDDSSAYRSSDEVESRLKNDSPISRFRLYLHSSYPSLWSPKLEAALTATFKSELLRAYKLAENEKRPGLEFMMTDVYEGMERPLLEQREELKRLVKKWGETKVWKKELEKYEGGKEAFLS
ncbi:Dehydrogenase, E1 component [Meredithblackwellia eburnea MCA 4105]